MSSQQQRAAILRDHADFNLNPKKAYRNVHASGHLAKAPVETAVETTQEVVVEPIVHHVKSGLVSLVEEAPKSDVPVAPLFVEEQQRIDVPVEVESTDVVDKGEQRQKKQKKQQKKQDNES